MVVVGHAADHTVFVSFCESNCRCAMVVQWTAACVCSGRRHACAVLVWVAVLLGFVGFPSVGG